MSWEKNFESISTMIMTFQDLKKAPFSENISEEVQAILETASYHMDLIAEEVSSGVETKEYFFHVGALTALIAHVQWLVTNLS